MPWRALKDLEIRMYRYSEADTDKHAGESADADSGSNDGKLSDPCKKWGEYFRYLERSDKNRKGQQSADGG